MDGRGGVDVLVTEILKTKVSVDVAHLEVGDSQSGNSSGGEVVGGGFIRFKDGESTRPVFAREGLYSLIENPKPVEGDGMLDEERPIEGGGVR